MADTAIAAQQLDAMYKEWLAVQRRYHAQLITVDNSAGNAADQQQQQQEPHSELPRRKRARCFISLSDPDLSEQFKGETELQFELPDEYPAAEPVFDLTHFQSRLSPEQFTAIDTAMKTRARELRGTLSLRKLLTFLDNNFYPLLLAATPAPANEGGAREALTHGVDTSAPSTGTESSSSTSDATEEASGLLAAKTTETTEQSTTTAKTKTKKKRKEKDTSKTPCRFFLRQSCKNGDECAFSHDITPRASAAAATAAAPASGEDSSAEPNKTDQSAKPLKANKTKTKKDKKTKESAAAETQSSAPAKTAKAARVKTSRACKFFALNKCRDGDACKFLHEAKAAAPGTGEPALGSHEATELKRIAIAVLPASRTTESSTVPTTSSNAVSKDQVASVAPTSSANNSSESWSEAQQKALDAALVKYPATLDKKMRWQRIASDVDGKSLNDCIDRFQLLCKIVRQTAQPSPAAVASITAPTVPAPAPAPAAPVPVPAASASTQAPPSRLATGTTTTESDDEQQPEDSNVNIDARIIPHSARTAIETEPAQRGAQIRLADLFLHAIGTLVPHQLVCQVQCTNCPLKLDATLALDAPSVRKWCPRCSVLHLVTMHAVFAHASSDVIAYVDTNEHCRVVDVVPSDLLATCLECNTEVLFPRVTPTRRAEHACFACHTKLALLTRRYVVGEFASSSSSSKHKQSSSGHSPTLSPTAKTKGTTKRVVENFVVGQPLPNRGVCEHYRHSYRWFRFQCCGKAFPCDVCHDASDCAEANMGKIASRMICGLCSKEQSSQVKTCACGNEVGRKKVVTSHWEGGAGCRDPTRMAQTDKKKFRGLHKTESKKHSRVGAAAKLARNGGRGGGSGSD